MDNKRARMDDTLSLPTIHPERCDGCGLCAAYCPGHAVEMVDAKPLITSPEDCSYCGICEEICPQSAIELLYQIG
ncbi:MAG: 4Fe-4S binding protein [Anaerolineaceae bacterium]|nr:4Fe-4S binding protein [Anaerolineaceae bacterium]